ncbi:MAG: hypothetical protein CL816_05625 [Coxiellaceae bacterium]|nr:hypothetical protein [Coxiellaceae bacterium]|tara:strand:+ start:1418 stop:1969 length:552 start_codon:yes stop_codon:yes gene_type:complete
MITSHQINLLIIIGIKGCGKSSVGQAVAQQLEQPWHDTDRRIEEYYAQKHGIHYDCKAIVKHHGWDFFCQLESQVFNNLSDLKHGVISTGGSSFFNSKHNHAFLNPHIIIYLACDIDELHQRWGKYTPPWHIEHINHPLSQKALHDRDQCFSELANHTIDVSLKTIDEISRTICAILEKSTEM